MSTTKKILIIFLLFIVFFISTISAIFFVSFKTSYKEFVLSASQKNDVDSALVFSVIKAESKFNKNAKSKAGAIGLMQIKLSTANYMLDLEGEMLITENQLFQVENNIDIGVKYLKYLIKKFNNVNVAICAYNAGETIVRDWLKNSEYSTDGKTLTKIPFTETENYLKKVNFNYKIYKKLL